MPSLTPETAAAQEELFLDSVRASMDDLREIVDPATGERIPGRKVREVEHDDGNEIRRLSASLGVHDRSLLDRLPRNRCVVWSVRTRGRLLGGRVRVVVVAAVVNPVRELMLGEPAPPRASFAAVARVVREHASGDGPARLVGIHSPTGWEIGMKLEAIRRPGLGLWLFEPGIAGGFAPALRRAETPPAPFDIESRQERIERVVEYVESHRFDLLMKGLAATEVARDLDMAPDDVRVGLEEAERRDEFLVLDRGDDIYLRRA